MAATGWCYYSQQSHAIDFEFLGLDPLDPPVERQNDQEEEDYLSKQLLFLAAKWWDCEARYSIIVEIQKGAKRADNGVFVVEKEPPCPLRDKRFVKVACPSIGG